MKTSNLRTLGLSILSLFLTSSAIAQVQPITISLKSYAFTPAPIVLKVGTAYRFHLSNDAGKGHSFSAPEFFAASAVVQEDSTKVVKGAVDLDSGEAVDITLTPMKAGSYALTCTHFLHSTFGMKGQITVQ